MISRLRLLILINWQERGKWHFLRYLKVSLARADVLQPVSRKRVDNSLFTGVSNYLSEFYVPIIALFRRKPYDVIVSWQMRIGICYGILNRLFHAGKPPVHILQDFHIDLTQKSMLYRAKMALLRLAIPGIDYFFCTSTEEEKIYSQMFGISRSRIVFMPLTSPRSHLTEPEGPRKDYIFSYGNSDRDYDALIRATGPMNIKTCILSQRYRLQSQLPENVSVIRERIAEDRLVQWITNSRMVVLPLKAYHVSAGQLSMLEVMALARPLVVTENMATKEYALHQESALFYSAGDSLGLAGHIQYLWDHPEAAEHIGRQARKSVLKLYDNRTTVFINLLERCAMRLKKGELR